MHNWALDSIAPSKQQAYAAHVVMRCPSMTARIEQRRQAVEVVCFLRATLMELTDIALLQASHPGHCGQVRSPLPLRSRMIGGAPGDC
ncbi:hypothetical protein [Variovorax ginsengisoli]|uniref:Uncharacterized protein n=1 Tax=Variovorax ginsengisoli TaxID=363844 RepID=A0ABT8SEF8_9BURK|nr:hypothetical protein [Variovorax ginsengisoli]MDN8617534.1 hypothetical protein [Variovorax ginsengisoli]MDO1536704.1 hypothetical protein [Variovorax ginsengisoli]